MRITLPSLSVLVLLTTTGYAQTPEEIKQMQKLQEMQQKSLESMNNSLPKMSDFMNSMTGIATKLEKMKRERSDRVQAKTVELETKVQEVLALVDAGKKSRAKIMAITIKWTDIGVINIDQERTKHFDDIRNELLLLIRGS